MSTASGCDSIIDLNLTVQQTLEETVSATICPNSSYEFNGTSYSSPGLFSAQLTSVAGCDSIAYLQLSQSDPITTTLTESICEGERILIGSQPYSISGVYTQVLTSAGGCDSTVILDLTVNQPQFVTLNESFCQGGSILVGNTLISQAGSYTFVLTSAAGCDSTINLNLSVAPTYFQQFSGSVCPGSSYAFGGQTFTSGGNYTVVLPTYFGCDSILTLDLFEELTIETVFNETICAGQTYEFEGIQYSNSGQYFAEYTTAGGCDSLIILNLEVVNGINTNLQETLCWGETIVFDGNTLSSSGTYTATYSSAGGCDSIVTLELTVLDRLLTELEENLCPGGSVQIGPQIFSSSGNYTVRLVNSTGCDSTITLDLYIASGDTTQLTESICQGSSITVGTETFSNTGIYVVDLIGSIGCDSTVRLDLSVASQVMLSQNESLCAGESVDVRGTTYTSPGVFSIAVPGQNGDCDTLITLTIQVGDVTAESVSATICEGDSYPFDGNLLTSAGTSSATFLNTFGCDSSITLQLEVIPAEATSVSASICTGETYLFDGNQLSSAGIYTANLLSSNGCDSMVTLTLELLSASSANLAASICSGETYQAGGQSFSVSGTYTLNLISANGCDSTLTLNLSVASTVELSQNEFLCDGASVDVRGTSYSSAGTYTLNIPGSAGACDTTLTLIISTATGVRNAITASICEGDTYLFDGQNLSSAGNYSASFIAASGCDSVVDLTLAVNQSSMSSLSETICAGDNYFFAGQTYTSAGIYTARFTASNGCDSTVVLTLQVEQPISQTVRPEICTGNTYTIAGQTFSSSGTYTIPLTSVGGCDSTLVVELLVVDSIVVDLSASICQGAGYTFGGQLLTAPGNYRLVSPSSAGCDSITRLELQVVDTIQTLLQASICEGDRYSFGGSSLNSTGTYTANLTSQGGCDSLVTLQLTVLEESTNSISRTICQGDQVIFAGQVYTTAGVYSSILTNSEGCDSVLQLNLQVVDLIEVDLQRSICTGESYVFGGIPRTVAGTYQVTDVSTAGCDSLTTLTLSISDTIRTNLFEEICAGETYTYNGVTYASSGRYEHAYNSSAGCDSIVTLSLTVRPEIRGTLDTLLCQGEVLRLNGQEFMVAGSYTLNFTAANGCDSIVALTLSLEACSFAVSSSASPVRCYGESNGAVSIEISGASFPLQLSYSLPAPYGVGDTILATLPSGGILTFSGLQAGIASLDFTDPSGTSASTTVEVTEPALPLLGELTISDYNGFGVQCNEAQNGSARVEVSGGTEPYDYLWSTGSTASSVSELGPGDIGINVLDENGCPWGDLATLTNPPALAVALEVQALACDMPELGGAILLGDDSSGLQPITMSVNGAATQQLENLSGLPAGTYVYTFTDALGCIARDTVELVEPEYPKLELGIDREIVAGDSIQLNLSSTVDLVDIVWTTNPGGGLELPNQAIIEVAPQVTTTYTATGYTAEGCPGEDVIQIRVRREDDIFVPSAFSPNNDGVNDQITIFTQDPLAEVLEFRIYDRWGEEMWSQKEFAPNELALGWNGLFRGEPMNPGVFVYYGKVRLRNGREVVVVGDFSLIR